MRISKIFRFEAAHILHKHPGKCSRLHGHSWMLRITVEGPVDPETGFVMDYGLLKQLVDKVVIDKLDHSFLGQGLAEISLPSQSRGGIGYYLANTSRAPFGPNFYPSSENLVVAIGKMLQPLIPEVQGASNVRIFEVHLEETCTSAASWRPESATEPTGNAAGEDGSGGATPPQS